MPLIALRADVDRITLQLRIRELRFINRASRRTSGCRGKSVKLESKAGWFLWLAGPILLSFLR